MVPISGVTHHAHELLLTLGWYNISLQPSTHVVLAGLTTKLLNTILNISGFGQNSHKTTWLSSKMRIGLVEIDEVGQYFHLSFTSQAS